MKLHFLGANRQVTGSRYCLEVGQTKLLIDCGMFQERPFLSRNWEPSPIPFDQLNALVLTHAHLDHCGLIPRLVGEGFAGPIFSTRPTVALAEIILEDSAKIQEEDAAYKRKRHQREKRSPQHSEVPLYTQAEVDKTLRLFQGQPYERSFEIGPGIRGKLWDAGHILGSAMFEAEVTEGEQQRRILFSGDVGLDNKPFIRNPTRIEAADYLVMESTYGDRSHETGPDIATHLCRVINNTISRGGNVVIPTFALERAQELLYYISQLVHDDRIPDIKVYLDSPMAIDVTETFRQFRDCFDEETWRLIAADKPPLQFPGLHMSRSVEQSKAINSASEPAVIMSSAGMCTAGRIKHHLRRNIERPESTVLFVGYQANGTLGRQILDRRESVRIHGRQYQVRAEVDQIYGFSGHADQPGLLRWLGDYVKPPRRVFLTHGEEDAAATLAEKIESRLGKIVSVPEYQTTVELE